MEPQIEEQEVESNLEKKPLRKGYSKEEDRIIMDMAMQFPDNLAHSFSEAAKKLKDRKTMNISSRYYYLVNTKKQKSVIMNGSAAGFSSHKNAKRKNGQLMRQEPLKPLSIVIKQLLEFNPEERKKVQEFLKLID